MNRFKAEEMKKIREARMGKAAKEVAQLDRLDDLKERVYRLAKEIHFERFPEEYDFRADSISDAAQRRRGINPMNEDYIQRVTRKRDSEGVSRLGSDGIAQTNETWETVLQDVLRKLI